MKSENSRVIGEIRFCFFKQKTAYELRISDWSSDVCSSDLLGAADHAVPPPVLDQALADLRAVAVEAIERARGDIEVELRSEERSAGIECVSPCGSRMSPYH